MAGKPPARIDLFRGTLDLLILKTLLPGPSHGHAIAKHIQRISEDLLQVQTGSLYPALYRLEAAGWEPAVERFDGRVVGRLAPTTEVEDDPVGICPQVIAALTNSVPLSQ